jgi:D-serine deaminase-like pyridoxal phosphate-dependent protein
VSTTIDQLETPEVLVDRDRLMANIERGQAIANRHALALRPHAKTHKCIEIAQLQIERGALGLTASKVDEAIVFVQSGAIRSITIAYPIVDRRKLERLVIAATRNDVELRITVDSASGIDVARDCGGKLRVFLKIDVGLHRCGIKEDAPDLCALAAQIDGNLEFAGLLSHAGHAYAASNLRDVVRVAEEERSMLLRVSDRLQEEGINVREISVGSTPTVLGSEDFGGITEIRPGNYVFADATAVRLGVASMSDVSLSVLTTIVSANDRYFIIDAGSKVLSSDIGAHGTTGNVGYGLAFRLDYPTGEPHRVVRLSEEHGFVERAGDLPIGTKLRVIPNHACPVANLAERLTLVSADQVVDQWPVAARSKVR